MKATGSLAKNTKLLCNKGLARRQGLIEFVEPNAVHEAEGTDSAAARGNLILRHDAGIVREVFNARYGELTFLSSGPAQAELQKRENLLLLVYRLYHAGRSRTPVELRRQLQTPEVEAVISSLQRLSFMGTISPVELGDYCEANAAKDDDLLAHVMDPLQLRYLLTYHCSGTREEISKRDLDTLKVSCRLQDPAGVKAWFNHLTTTCESLPGDTPQFLRSVLLELWKAGDADLSALAREIAVLDAQLFEVLGWESTRAFCAQLRRVTGPRCEVLDAYLTDEEIDGALMIAEELEQTDLIAHFRKLASSYNTKLHRDLRRNVLSAAGHAREQDTTPPVAKSSRTASPIAYPMGLSAAAN